MHFQNTIPKLQQNMVLSGQTSLSSITCWKQSKHFQMWLYHYIILCILPPKWIIPIFWWDNCPAFYMSQMPKHSGVPVVAYIKSYAILAQSQLYQYSGHKCTSFLLMDWSYPTLLQSDADKSNDVPCQQPQYWSYFLLGYTQFLCAHATLLQ